MLELQLRVACRTRNRHRLRPGQRCAALDELYLAHPSDLAYAARQLVDHALLECAQLVDVNLRLREGDAPRAGVARFVNHLRDMQQRFRWDAAAIETDAARVLLHVDERDLHAEVGGVEGRRVAARPRAEDGKLSGFARHASAEE